MHKWFGDDFHVLKNINLSLNKARTNRYMRAVRFRKVHADPLHQQARRASARRIIVDDIELTFDIKNIEKIRAEVGMVFQHFKPVSALDDFLTISRWGRSG